MKVSEFLFFSLFLFPFLFAAPGSGYPTHKREGSEGLKEKEEEVKLRRSIRSNETSSLEGYPVREYQFDFARKLLRTLRRKNKVKGTCQAQNRVIKVFQYWKYWTCQSVGNVGCENNCILVDNMADADVVYTFYSTTPIPDNLGPKQMLVGYDVEPRWSDEMRIYSADSLDKSKALATYKLDSNIPTLYLRPNSWETAMNLGIPSEQDFNSRKLIIFVSSNCVQRRMDIMSEFMKYLPIESRGRCLTNAPVISGPHSDAIPHYKGYKFVISFQSRDDPDYITEKFFNPFYANSVGVNFGSKTAHLLAPGKDSFIDAAQFPNLSELADYIKRIGSNYSEWVKFFEWKKQPKSPIFPEIEKMSMDHPSYMCRICDCICHDVCSLRPNPGLGITKFPPFLNFATGI